VNQDTTRRRRRIVVTVDSGDVDAVEFERLSRLAHRMGAELEGVFVEDSDLLRLAGLTFLEEFRPTSGRAERFHSTRMQQELRAVARRAERALAEYAERRGVPCSFRVWRGSMERELLAGLQADIVALMRLGAVALQPPRRRAAEVISAYFDGSEEAGRALRTAADIAADSDRISLQILLAQSPGTGPEELKRKAQELLPDQPGEVSYHSLEDHGLAELVQILEDAGSSALVIHRDNELLRSAPLRESLSRLHCPLFLVS